MDIACRHHGVRFRGNSVGRPVKGRPVQPFDATLAIAIFAILFPGQALAHGGHIPVVAPLHLLSHWGHIAGLIIVVGALIAFYRQRDEQ